MKVMACVSAMYKEDNGGASYDLMNKHHNWVKNIMKPTKEWKMWYHFSYNLCEKVYQTARQDLLDINPTLEEEEESSDSDESADHKGWMHKVGNNQFDRASKRAYIKFKKEIEKEVKENCKDVDKK